VCHAPHTKQAPAAVTSRVARPHDAMGSVRHMSHAALLRARGLQAVAAMHLTLGAHGEAFHTAHQLLPARASVAPACQGRAQTTDAAARALPPLKPPLRTGFQSAQPPLGLACPAAPTFTAKPLAPTAALLNSASLLPTHQIRLRKQTTEHTPSVGGREGRGKAQASVGGWRGRRHSREHRAGGAI
jgi:hypothetical protein